VVLLTDPQPETSRKFTFWDAETHEQDKAGQLMKALDHINTRYGRDTLQYASAGLRNGLEMRRKKVAGVHHALEGYPASQGVRDDNE
jgi:hypothetical protein